MRCEWEKTKLGEMVVFNPKLSLPKGSVAKKIAMEHLLPFSKYITKFELSSYAGGAKFMNGDTLLARITPCLENGKTSQVTMLDENEIGFGSTEFIVLRAKDGLSDKDFIYYLSISPQFRDYAIKSMVGSSGRQRVQQDVLENMYIDCPSIQEQKAIAAVLSALDDKIELNNRINKNLEAQAQAIFKSWFVDFEPFRDGEFVESELGLIPKGWKADSLDSIANFTNGLAMQKFRPKPGELGLPVLKIKELRQGSIDATSELCSSVIDKDYIVKDGDVIFSWSGSLMVDIWCGGTCGLNQHLFKVTSSCYDKWFYYMWTCYHLAEFQAIAQDKATTMGHIKRSHLAKAKVVIPSKTEYHKLNSVISPLVDLIIKNRLQNQKLAILRDTLLPKLMSGEIRVPLEV